MTMIDTPDGIAFFRAAARKGALDMEIKGLKRSGGRQTAYAIVKDVYGFHGSRKSVLDDLTTYVEGTLYIRRWSPEYSKRIVDIVDEATRRAIEEHGTITTKDPIDANIQAFFDAGSITAQEGDDACLLTFIEVVRKYAGGR